MARRKNSYGRQQVRALKRAYLAKHWRILLKLFGMLAGISLAVALAPLPDFPNAERGFFVGVLLTTWAAIAVHGFMSDGTNDLRVYGLWAEEDWSRHLLDDSKHVWSTVHRIEFDGFDVDHVAVTPAGVLAVETKWVATWRKDDRCLGYLDQTARNAKKIKSLLRSTRVGIPDVPVIPVLVLWGPGSRALNEQARDFGDVTVLPGLQAHEHLARYGTGPVSQAVATTIREKVQGFVQVHEAHAREAA